MTVLITLTVAGTDTGPFNLYSNLDGYFIPFETGVSKAALLAGYSSSLVPDYTTIVRIVSIGNCTNYIDIPLISITTTTTTTIEPTTTTTTTTVAVISCGIISSFSGGVSYPTTQSIILGTDTGTVVLNYNAVNIPDRFIVDWNSSFVIDTGYRGNADYDFGGLSRSSFTSSLTGLIDPITLNVYPDFTTYPDDGYPRILGLGLGTTSFIKNLASNTFATIKVYAPMSNTSWIYEMDCPTTSTTTTTTTIEPTTTTTTTIEPTTTTTTTTVAQPQPSTISSLSDASDACLLSIDSICYVNTASNPGFIAVGNFVYNDSGQTSPLIGGSQYWKITISGSLIIYSAQIDNSGQIIGTMTIC